MDEMKKRWQWTPTMTAMVGFVLSLIIWFLLRHNGEISTDLHHVIAPYDSYMDVISDIGVSVLLALLVGFMHLSRQRDVALQQSNKELKSEITERIKSESERQELETALLQGQKLQAIGTLAGGIAHDFNNLLYAIIGYVEMSREDVPKDAMVYKNLGKVLEAAQRGQDLVSRILVFSRRQHQNFDVLNLNQVITSALGLLVPAIPSSVMVDFEPSVQAMVLGNQTQLHQVILNIVNNAVHAMDDEGNVHIELTAVPKNDPYLRHFPQLDNKNYYRINITDTGHGIDQSTMERIFEPFFTTKEVGKGTGLGLSIVHSIVKEHQGEITVSSQPGHGTTFTILLPEYLST